MIKVFLFFLLTNLGMSKVHVQGHRGARAVMPENTMEGFRYALALGVDFLELDLGVSKDGHVIITHDPVVNTNICSSNQEKAPFYTLTLSQIKTIDCGSKPNPKFPKQKKIEGARIPTLEEFFQWVQESKTSTVQFNIEIKSFPQHPQLTPAPQEFAQLVYDIVQRYGMRERTVIQSFDPRSLRAIRSLDPLLRVSLLVRSPNPDPLDQALELKAEFISPRKDWPTREQVANWKDHGIKTVPWTANTEKDWARLIELGVDGIITDDPAGLLSFLKMTNEDPPRLK